MLSYFQSFSPISAATCFIADSTSPEYCIFNMLLFTIADEYVLAYLLNLVGSIKLYSCILLLYISSVSEGSLGSGGLLTEAVGVEDILNVGAVGAAGVEDMLNVGAVGAEDILKVGAVGAVGVVGVEDILKVGAVEAVGVEDILNVGAVLKEKTGPGSDFLGADTKAWAGTVDEDGAPGIFPPLCCGATGGPEVNIELKPPMYFPGVKIGGPSSRELEVSSSVSLDDASVSVDASLLSTSNKEVNNSLFIIL